MMTLSKNIKNILTIFLCLLIFMISVSAVAIEIRPRIVTGRAGVNLSEDKVYVEGVIENGWVGRTLTLLILFPNTDINNIKKKDIASMNQTLTAINPDVAENPIFSFDSYRMQETAPTGEYTIWIKGYGLDDVTHKFSYKGADDLYVGLDTISKALNISNAILEVADDLEIDGAAYSNLSSGAKALVNPKLVAKIGTFNISGYGDYATNPGSARAVKGLAVEFRSFYSDMIAIAQFSDKDSAQGIKEWLTTYASKVKLKENDEDVYELYEKDMANKQKEALHQALSTINTLDSFEKIRKAFYEQTLLKGIELLPWTKTKKIITDFSVRFETENSKLNWSDFNKLDNKDIVYESIAGNPYATLDAVRVAFNAAVGGRLSIENAQSSAGGSGVSRGSSGGSISIRPVTSTDAEHGGEVEQGAKKIFEDISTTHWAGEAISSLAQKGIISGRGAGKFEPDASVTRAEFIKILMGAFNLKAATGGNGFTDVAESDWYYPYIAGAKKYGIATGTKDGSFKPNADISRQDMMVLLFRAIDISGVLLPEQVRSISFNDNLEIADYAQNAVSTLANVGIISGMDDGSFAPLGNATRAQAARVVYELMKLMK